MENYTVPRHHAVIPQASTPATHRASRSGCSTECANPPTCAPRKGISAHPHAAGPAATAATRGTSAPESENMSGEKCMHGAGARITSSCACRREPHGNTHTHMPRELHSMRIPTPTTAPARIMQGEKRARDSSRAFFCPRFAFCPRA